MKFQDGRFKNDWLSFYPSFSNFYLMYNCAGYFERRPIFHCFLTQILSIILLAIFGFHLYSMPFVFLFFIPWGELYIYLPIISRYDECEPPRYGIYYHSAGIWICNGRKIKCIHMPYDYGWVRTSKLLFGGTWEHETAKNRFNPFQPQKPKNIYWSADYSYIYILKNGKIQQRIATVTVEEREWRQRWLKWTHLFSKNRKTIAVEFSYGGPASRKVLIEKTRSKDVIEKEHREQTGEVGERTGSWKGGTLGCGYEMLPSETPLQTLRRMERERKF